MDFILYVCILIINLSYPEVIEEITRNIEDEEIEDNSDNKKYRDGNEERRGGGGGRIVDGKGGVWSPNCTCQNGNDDNDGDDRGGGADDLYLCHCR